MDFKLGGETNDRHIEPFQVSCESLSQGSTQVTNTDMDRTEILNGTLVCTNTHCPFVSLSKSKIYTRCPVSNLFCVLR